MLPCFIFLSCCDIPSCQTYKMPPRIRKKKTTEDNINLRPYLHEKSFDEALSEAPIEEHFVLRLPEKVAQNLRKMVQSRGEFSEEQLSLAWKDQRHGKMTVLGQTLSTTLVDLPCITESYKTLDNKQFYKIADVSQMVIAHPRTNPPTQGKDYTWPDGLSYPLRDIRNSRFRKRMNKKVVEDVELEVERLLLADFEADDVTFEVLERKENESSEEDEELSEDDSDIGQGVDFDIDAAIDEALDKPDEEEEEESDDESDESDQEEVDPDEKNEENELKIQANSLRHEISAMEIKLEEKNKLALNQVNAIMKVRELRLTRLGKI